MLTPSYFPKSVNWQVNSSTPGNFCGICKHCLVAELKFTSRVIGERYFIKGNLFCNSKKGKYLFACEKCKNEYAGSAVDSKPRFSVCKSDIKAGKAVVVPFYILIKISYVLLPLWGMSKFKLLGKSS